MKVFLSFISSVVGILSSGELPPAGDRPNNKQIRLRSGRKVKLCKVNIKTALELRGLPVGYIAFDRQAVGDRPGKGHFIRIFQLAAEGDTARDGRNTHR